MVLWAKIQMVYQFWIFFCLMTGNASFKYISSVQTEMLKSTDTEE